MTVPNYSFILSAQLVGTEGISVGDVCLPDDPTTGYQISSAANRGSRRSEGVALTAYQGGGRGSFQVQQAGAIDAAVSGLQDGASCFVRASTAGRIERAPEPLEDDDVIGWAETNGRVHLFFGLPSSLWMGVNALPDGGNYRDVLTIDNTPILPLDAVDDGTDLWIYSNTGGSLLRINPITNELVATITLEEPGTSDIYGFSQVTQDSTHIFVAASATLYVISKASSEIVGLGSVGGAGLQVTGCAVEGDAVFTTTVGEDGAVSRFSKAAMLSAYPTSIDATHSVLPSALSPSSTALTNVFVGGGFAWVPGLDEGVGTRVYKLSLSDLSQVDQWIDSDIGFTQRGVYALGFVWVARGTEVVKLDPNLSGTGEVGDVLPPGVDQVTSLAFDGTYVWATSFTASAGLVTQINPADDSIVGSITTNDEYYSGISASDGRVWACTYDTTRGLRTVSPGPIDEGLFVGSRAIIWDKPPVEHETTGYQNYNLQRVGFGLQVNPEKQRQTALGTPGSGIGSSSYTDGNWASVLGGRAGKATDDGATVIGGLDGQAVGKGSTTVGGESSIARLGGMLATGSFGTVVGAPGPIAMQECSWFGGAYSDNNATSDVLNRDGLPIALEDGKTYAMEIVVVASRQDAPGGGTRRCQATFTCAGGVATQVGTTETLGTSTLPAGVAFAFGTPSALTIPMTFDGVVAQTWQASVRITWDETQGAA